MDQNLLWQKINAVIEAQKNLDKFLFEQKAIVADLILRVTFLMQKSNVSEGEYNEHKETFFAKLDEHKKSLESVQLRSEESGSDVGNDSDSRSELPGEKSHRIH